MTLNRVKAFVLPDQKTVFVKIMSLSNPNVAVLLNKERVEVVEWQNYLKENWETITAYLEQNAKIVIIAGRHGNYDGKTCEGRPEEFILKNHENLVGQKLLSLCVLNTVLVYNVFFRLET